MFLKKFVDELAIVDSEENKQRLIIEAIGDGEVIDPSNAVTVDLFGNKARPSYQRNIDPKFEEILVSMDIPDTLPPEHKRDYITDKIDNCMGIKHAEPIIAVPVAEAVDDKGTYIKDNAAKKIMTISASDRDDLNAIISNYETDTANRSKNGLILRRFLDAALKNVNKLKFSGNVESCIKLMYTTKPFGPGTKTEPTKNNNDTSKKTLNPGFDEMLKEIKIP